jgi:acyl carrier protein
VRQRLPRAAAGPGAHHAGAPLRERLAGLGRDDREALLANLVRAHAAAVLGHAAPGRIEPDRPFVESGFDSLTAVELRNLLQTATGLRLPATSVFDHPSPARLARHLCAELFPPATAPDLLADVDRLIEALSATDPDAGQRLVAEARLRAALSARHPGGVPDPDASMGERLHTVSDEELFSIIDGGL